jgi:hypothetical protein
VTEEPKPETALAIPQPDDTSVEGLRAAIARAREDLVKTASALKQDLTPLARAREVVVRHPWLSLGAALTFGYFIGRRKD